MLRKDLEIFLSSCQKVNFEKKYFSHFSHNCNSEKKKKKKIIIFLVTLQSMAVPNFMSKAFSFQDLRREHYVSPLPPGHDQAKAIPAYNNFIIISVLFDITFDD